MRGPPWVPGKMALSIVLLTSNIVNAVLVVDIPYHLVDEVITHKMNVVEDYSVNIGQGLREVSGNCITESHYEKPTEIWVLTTDCSHALMGIINRFLNEVGCLAEQDVVVFAKHVLLAEFLLTLRQESKQVYAIF